MATGTPVATATPVATGTPTASASGGYYRFDNLPTFVERNGERYLAGYQLQLCEMPKGYAATKCRIGEDTAKDSDLFADTLHLYEDADEVIILAEASSGNDFYDRNVGDNAYDIVKAKDNTDYDGGLTAIETASIESYIWNDENYNGIQDENEVGVATATVKLTRKYYDDSDKTWKQDDSFTLVAEGAPVATSTPVATGTPVATATPVATGTPTASASGGYYRFDNLPTFVERNGERYLAGYQLQLCEMPKGYAATKCRIGEDTAKDSDLFADTLHLYEDADEVIILAEASSGNDFYDRNVGDNAYDIVKAKDNTDYDGGLTAIETASIESYIWNDENYNGIQDENEVGVATATVKLTRSYYDSRDTTWKLDDSFVLVATGTPVATATPVATGTPVATATPVATGTPMATASGGHYRFDNLPTYIEKDGQRYLVGYQMQLCEMPEGYAATKYHAAADSDKDSDLIAGTLDLQEPDTFLILAKAFSGNTPYCCQVRGVDYDIVKAADVTGYDGGIVQKDSHVSISGIVWDDADRDHQISDGESGIANVKIILRQYYRRNGKWELLPEAKQVAYTNADGQYRFDDLPLSVTVDGVTYLAGYRLWIDSIPAGYNAEEYADISSGSVEIRAEERTLDGCMILGIPEEKGVTSGTCLEGFNIAKGEDMAFLNVFLNRDPEESTETTTATDLVTTTTETAVSTESTTQTSTSASAETTSVESSTTETSTATTQTTASTTESSTATTRTTASTTKTSTTTTRTTASTTKTSTTTARTTASTTKTSTTTTQTTAKTQSSHTTATTRTHTTATKQTTSSVTTSKQTTHSTSHTTTAKVTASPATHTIAKTTTHTTHTTSHRTTAGTTSITTQRTSVTTSRTTGTTHTTATVTTTGSTSVTTSAIHRTTSSTTQHTTATVTLSSAGPTSVTTTTHTTSTQTTPKQTTVSQTNTTSVAPTSRTTSATVPTTGTTSTGTTDSSASTGTQTTHHSTHTTTQTTTVTETTVNSTCETSSASTSIRQTTLRKNHVSGDTVTTTTTVANREHAAGHHTQTTTTAADVSAQTSGTKRIPLPRQQNISGTPKTGDTTLHITILIAACGFSLLLAILTKRRKK